MKFTDILMAGHQENTVHAIECTMETYQTPWKVVHETLQNALDAIYRTGNNGHISITIDITDQSVRIRDDGQGFPHGDEGVRLLGLHGSDKDGDERLGGNLGFGLKAVICATSYFKLMSYRDGKSWGFEITSGHELQEAEYNSFDSREEPDAESGTELYYRFPNNEVTTFLNEVYGQTPGVRVLNQYSDTVNYLSRKDDFPSHFRLLVTWYFWTASYAANIDRLIYGANSSVPQVDIALKILAPTMPSRDEGEINEDILDILHLLQGSIDIQFENKYWDIEEYFMSANGKTRVGLPFTITKDLDLSTPNTHKLKSEQVVILKFTTVDEYKTLIRYPNGKIVNPDRDDTYYARKLYDDLRGVYVVVGRKRYLDHMLLPNMPYRQSAFARGIPTQDIIGLPSGVGESARSDNTILFAPNVNDKLNLGKLQIAYRRRITFLREFYSDFFLAHLRRISAEVATREDTQIEDMPFAVDDNEPTDFVDRETVFRPGSERNVIIKPIYENELIALFFELLGRQELQGYQFYGLSGYSRYDGKAEILLPNRDSLRSAINQDSKLFTIEFKVLLSVLVKDLEKNKKRATQLHLLIVWEADQDKFTNDIDFKVVPVDDFLHLAGVRFPPDRRFPHVEKLLCIRVEGRWLPVQILELRSIVQEINTNMS